ncbi:hypothetical protein B9Z19DRAFT_1135069 [Tuber borchii]|uniref:FDX-ACB domain-containing protein n=1 Tax=Tuber borchii TaxID=42251 RepID=A0A2T6ZDH7_TUBBO|nr:hypothetical protein B9Z19DRAFT_1135069 [Tuber borchii]
MGDYWLGVNVGGTKSCEVSEIEFDQEASFFIQDEAGLFVFTDHQEDYRISFTAKTDDDFLDFTKRKTKTHSPPGLYYSLSSTTDSPWHFVLFPLRDHIHLEVRLEHVIAEVFAQVRVAATAAGDIDAEGASEEPLDWWFQQSLPKSARIPDKIGWASGVYPDVAGDQIPLHESHRMEIVRTVAGYLVDDVKLMDEFTHPRTKRKSLCFRINHRSLEKTLKHDEVNSLVRTNRTKTTAARSNAAIRKLKTIPTDPRRYPRADRSTHLYLLTSRLDDGSIDFVQEGFMQQMMIHVLGI